MNAKKGLNIAANVCSIVIGAILFLAALLAYVIVDEYVNSNSIDIVIILLMLFSLAIIVLASFSLAKKNSLALKIAVLVLMALLAICEFIGEGYVFGVLCLIPIGLGIAAIVVKDSSKEEKNNKQSLESKIAELKHLKEINVLTEDQYNESVKKLTETL